MNGYAFRLLSYETNRRKNHHTPACLQLKFTVTASAEGTVQAKKRMMSFTLFHHVTSINASTKYHLLCFTAERNRMKITFNAILYLNKCALGFKSKFMHFSVPLPSNITIMYWNAWQQHNYSNNKLWNEEFIVTPSYLLFNILSANYFHSLFLRMEWHIWKRPSMMSHLIRIKLRSDLSWSNTPALWQLCSQTRQEFTPISLLLMKWPH